ncbi:deoxynucleoside kinase [Lactobacillus jensenii]|nr:deoxynucleoside kinase [Lactobacillus jensenii]
MSRGIIILIEGISNSGKTTLCNSLKNKANFEIIPEAIRYLENTRGAS